MSDLNTDVRYIKGIGEKKALALNKLGVFSLYDLLSYFPRRYEDRTQFKPIALTMDGETVCIQAVVADTPRLSRIRRGLDLVRFHAVDDSGSVEITYFNQSYIKDNLHRGDEVNFYGRIEVKGTRRSMANPVFEREGSGKGATGRIIPIYRLSSGINQASLVSGIRQSLDCCLDSIKITEAVVCVNNIAEEVYNMIKSCRTHKVTAELKAHVCSVTFKKSVFIKCSCRKIGKSAVYEFESIHFIVGFSKVAEETNSRVPLDILEKYDVSVLCFYRYPRYRTG